MSTSPLAGILEWPQGEATVRLDVAPAEVVTVASRLWSRIARGVSEIAPADWERPTRCSEWRVVDIVNHLADGNDMAAQAVTETLAGGESHVFDGFDPRTVPKSKTDVADRDPAVAQRRLVTAVEQMLAGLDILDATSIEPMMASPLGPQPLAAGVMHLFWDAWLHERDLFIPLGVAVPELADEVRLAALYSLRMIGFVQGMVGREVHVPLVVDGALDAALVLDVHGGSMSARVLDASAAESPHLRGDAATTVDALCGRGDLATVVEGPDELRRNLSILRKVLAGA